MNPKAGTRRNEYRCAMELNQSGKYCIRLRIHFGRHNWTLPVYFLASSFDRAMQKLGEAFQFFQRHEERLWFWCVERSDDPKLAGEFLSEAGLRLDHRGEFPAKSAGFSVLPDKPVAASHLAPVRRGLTETLAATRPAASD